MKREKKNDKIYICKVRDQHILEYDTSLSRHAISIKDDDDEDDVSRVVVP